MFKKLLKPRSLCMSAVIAALYAALTLLLAPISYGPIQLRLSEALTLLPMLLPQAVPGLFVGCLIANLYTGMLTDIIFGSLATLIAATGTYFLRKKPLLKRKLPPRSLSPKHLKRPFPKKHPLRKRLSCLLPRQSPMSCPLKWRRCPTTSATICAIVRESAPSLRIWPVPGISCRLWALTEASSGRPVRARNGPRISRTPPRTRTIRCTVDYAIRRNKFHPQR